MEDTLYKEAKQLNIPIDQHESDLYLKSTSESAELIRKYRGNYKLITLFTSQIDNERWYDIPFAYDPFWESKVR